MTLPEDSNIESRFAALQAECKDLKLNLRMLHGEVHRLVDELLNSKIMQMRLMEKEGKNEDRLESAK